MVSEASKIQPKNMMKFGKALIQNGLYYRKEVIKAAYALSQELWNAACQEGDIDEAIEFVIKLDYENLELDLTNQQKFERYINIASAYNQNKMFINAEPYIRKCQKMKSSIKDDKLLVIFSYCNSQFLDFNKRFLYAAFAYYEICKNGAEIVEQLGLELNEVLRQALVATVLSEEGDKKRFLISQLVKDERIKKLEHYDILEKFHFNKFTTEQDVQTFAKDLEPHQNIETTEGMTSLEQIMMEHNIIVISKLYRDISINSIAKRLNIKRQQVEKYLQNMNSEGKLSVIIDHRADNVVFKKTEEIMEDGRNTLEKFCKMLEGITG